jgi:hypothetical protein
MKVTSQSAPDRVGAFSDGVFAIVITIMILELKKPEGATFQALGADTVFYSMDGRNQIGIDAGGNVCVCIFSCKHNLPGAGLGDAFRQ